MDFPEIPNHTVNDTIGEGRTGPVYKGIQESLQREVAIKLMSPKLLPHKDVVQEFLDRARVAASLSHPNIISIYNVDQFEDDQIYYTMEFLTGGSLVDRLEDSDGMKPFGAARLTLKIANALEQGHKKDTDHGNLKPSKILFMDDGETFKLAGLGLLLGVVAKHSARNPTPFTPPEVIQTEAPADYRADIFSLGVIFYYMLIGKRLFEKKDKLWKARSSGLEVVPPSEVFEELPAEVDRIILKMMVFDPESRYQSYSDLIEDLEKVTERLTEKESKQEEAAPKTAEKKTAVVVTDDEDLEEIDSPPKKKKQKKKKAATAAKVEDDDQDGEEEDDEDDDHAPVASKVGKKAIARKSAAPTQRGSSAVRRAKEQNFPIGSMLMAFWSLLLLGGAIYYLKFRDEGEARETATTTTVLAQTPTPNRVKPESLTQLPQLENPLTEVNELVDKYASSNVLSKVNPNKRYPRGFVKLAKLANQEAAQYFEEERYVDSLASLGALHNLVAKNDSQRKYAAFLIAEAVKKVDQKFERDRKTLQRRVDTDELEGAKLSYNDLGRSYQLDRYKKKARAEIAKIDRLFQNREGEGGIKQARENVLAFKKELEKVKVRADRFARNYEFEKAADVYKDIANSAPNDKLKQHADHLRKELQYQSQFFNNVVTIVKEKGNSLNLKLKIGRMFGVLTGADRNGLYLTDSGFQAKVRYNKLKPRVVYTSLNKLPLDSKALFGLAAFCFSNGLETEGERSLEKAMVNASDDLNTSIMAYLESRQAFQASGGIVTAVKKEVSSVEAKDIYVTAIFEMAVGQKDRAKEKLQSIVDNYPDTQAARDARKLLDGKVDETIQEELALSGKDTGTEGVDEGTIKSATGPVGKGEEAYKLAMENYQKSLPGQPNRSKFNELAFKYFTLASKYYIDALKKDPGNEQLQQEIQKVNMLRYGCMKSRTLN